MTGVPGTPGVPFTVGKPVVANIVCPVTFLATRSADGASVTVTSSFAGAFGSLTDVTTPDTTFDQLAILVGSGFGNATTPTQQFFDNDVVTHTAIPEPASIATLTFVTSVTALRRRRA